MSNFIGMQDVCTIDFTFLDYNFHIAISQNIQNFSVGANIKIECKQTFRLAVSR